MISDEIRLRMLRQEAEIADYAEKTERQTAKIAALEGAVASMESLLREERNRRIALELRAA